MAEAAHEHERRELERRIAAAEIDLSARRAREDETTAALERARAEIANLQDKLLTAAALTSAPDPVLLSALDQARQDRDRAAEMAGEAARRREALATELGVRSSELAKATEAAEAARSGARLAAEESRRELAGEKAAAQELRNLLEAERTKRRRAEDQVAELARQQSRAEEAAAKQSAAARASGDAVNATAERLRQAEAKAVALDRDNAALKASLDAQRGQLQRTEAALTEVSRARALAEEGSNQTLNAQRAAEEAGKLLAERLRQEQAKSAASQRQVESLRASLDAERANVARAENKLAEAVRDRAAFDDLAARRRREAESAATAAAERLRQEQARAAELGRHSEGLRAELESEREQRRRIEAKLDQTVREQAERAAQRDDAAVREEDATARASLAQTRAQSAEREAEELRRGAVGVLRWLESRVRGSSPGPEKAAEPDGTDLLGIGQGNPMWRDILSRLEDLLRDRERDLLRREIEARPREDGSRLRPFLLDTQVMWSALPAFSPPPPERAQAQPQIAIVPSPPPGAAADQRSAAKEGQNQGGAAPEPSSLLMRAEAFLSRGDVVGARLLLDHAAAEGSGIALFRLAETYDPQHPIIRRLGSATADRERAIQLYRSALAAGIEGAEERIAKLN